MPLTPEQTAALTSALDALKEADPADVAAALKAQAQPVFQAAYDEGHASGAGSVDVAAKDREAARLARELKKAQDEAKRLAEAAPDLAAERARYEQALQDKDKERDEAVAAERKRYTDAELARAEAEVLALLTSGEAGGRVEARYAKHALVPELRARIQISEDGNRKVMKADGLTPLAADNPLLALAKEAVGTVDAAFLLSGADGGSGARGGSGSGARASDTPQAAAQALAPAYVL